MFYMIHQGNKKLGFALNLQKWEQYCALTEEKSPDSSVLAILEMALDYLSLSGHRAEVSLRLRIICL